MLDRLNLLANAVMTLDASGNLGVGTTSPVGRIDTNDSVNDISYTSFRNSNTGASARARLRIGNNGSSNAFTVDVYGGNHSTSANLVEITNQFNAALSFGTNGIERGRFSAAGNFGISEGNNPTQVLSLYRAGSTNALMSAGNSNTGLDGAWFGVDTTGNGIVNVRGSFPLLFSTNANERGRFTAGGDFLTAGKTTASFTTVGAELLANGQINTASANLDNLNVYNTTAAAYRFYVSSGGTVFATNTTISAISDQRLKENVRDLDVGLDAIMALKPRKFDWKEGKGQDKKDVRGFIAQEFEQVFPDLIDEWKDPAPEGEEPYKSVRQDLIPVLVKAIQELSAKVAALEAK